MVGTHGVDVSIPKGKKKKEGINGLLVPKQVQNLAGKNPIMFPGLTLISPGIAAMSPSSYQPSSCL
jgi:hypothetical protein